MSSLFGFGPSTTLRSGRKSSSIARRFVLTEDVEQDTHAPTLRLIVVTCASGEVALRSCLQIGSPTAWRPGSYEFRASQAHALGSARVLAREQLPEIGRLDPFWVHAGAASLAATIISLFLPSPTDALIDLNVWCDLACFIPVWGRLYPPKRLAHRPHPTTVARVTGCCTAAPPLPRCAPVVADVSAVGDEGDDAHPSTTDRALQR